MASKPKFKILTFLWRKNVGAYEVTVWEQDPAAKSSPAPTYIPKGPITMTMPEGMSFKESSMGFCFGSSALDLWMTARSPTYLSILKISTNLDIMSVINVGAREDYFPRDDLIHARDCIVYKYPSPDEMKAKLNNSQKFEDLKVKAEPSLHLDIKYNSTYMIWNKSDQEFQYPGFFYDNIGNRFKFENPFNIENWVKQIPEPQQSNQNLINPAYTYPEFKYIYHAFARGGKDHPCELYLNFLQSQYLPDWTAKKSGIVWKTIQVQTKDTGLPEMTLPLVRMIVIKNKDGFLLYIFLMDQTTPNGIKYFYLRLRNDGSLDTYDTKISFKDLYTIPVQSNDGSDIRLEMLDGRVFCFYPQDWKVTGKSAPIGADGFIRDEWSDFCSWDKRTPMVDSRYFGSVVVPDGLCVTPSENYKSLA
ncbi:hypothetical protein FBEOM_10842 [Fusarium beomiforme]|uniref:Uncharacterized protein n=1 Tax=Fusarium beomiforme TaxID=44412 RepID=A0A9P5AAJ1_9HYPO|nr:hypothetical protein FBEOM_10842 [Fusarium beomiforme]